MLYGLYLSAAGLQAQEYRQTVQANNLANSTTPGFKRDLAIFQARKNAVQEDGTLAQYRVPVMAQQGGGVKTAETAIDLTQGSLDKTSSATDVALEGQGFFTVQGSNGEQLLTRDGRFIIDNQNQLVMAGNGKKVLGADGQPIKLNSAEPVSIDTRGTIHQAETNVAQLGIVNVKQAGDLIKRGENTYSLREGASTEAAPSGTAVRQCYREGSSVEPMTEMVTMLEGTRVYEANAKMITYQDQTLQQLNTVGRVA